MCYIVVVQIRHRQPIVYTYAIAMYGLICNFEAACSPLGAPELTRLPQ